METDLHAIWPDATPTENSTSEARNNLMTAIKAEHNTTTNTVVDFAKQEQRRRPWKRGLAGIAAAAAVIAGVVAIDIGPSPTGGVPEVSLGSPAQAMMNDLSEAAESAPATGTGTVGRLETAGPDGYQSLAYFLEDGTFIQSYDDGATYGGVRGLYPSLDAVEAFPTDDSLVPAALDELAALNTDLAGTTAASSTVEIRMTEVNYLLWDGRLSGEQRSALYRYLGSLDFVEADGPTNDSLGRPGVTLRINHTNSGSATIIVFDETTGATLETRFNSGAAVINGETNVESYETYVDITLVDTAPNTCAEITDYTSDANGAPTTAFIGETC